MSTNPWAIHECVYDVAGELRDLTGWIDCRGYASVRVSIINCGGAGASFKLETSDDGEHVNTSETADYDVAAGEGRPVVLANPPSIRISASSGGSVRLHVSIMPPGR